MQTVSDEWKSNQRKTLVNESFVEVSLDIADPDAIADASSEDNGAIYISNTPQVVSVVDKNVVPYFTLEQNLWVLDGSRKAIPQTDYGNNGYVGDVLSGANGGFNDKIPTVTVNFTEVHRNVIPAVTITWGSAYDEFAEDFVVTAYNDTTVIAKKEVLGNKSVKSVVEVDINNYNKIVITILRWCLPHRRARIEEIFVGMNKVYSKSDLFSYAHSQTVDPISTSLPKAEVSFSIDNVDNSYNPYNTGGMAKYLMERQEVKTRYGFKLDNAGVEWIDGGNFYLSEWDAPQNGLSASFTARDLLEFMSATYYEGVYTPSGVDLYTLAERVLEKANLPLNNDGSVKWLIDDSLKSIYTTAPLPLDTLANCLQLIANAGCCVLYQDRGGTLHLEPIDNTVSDYSINYDNSYSKSDISLSKPLKQVNTSLYHYFIEESGSELYNGTVYVNGTKEIMLTYSGAGVNASATVSGGTLESAEYYTNACKLTITATGDVSITINGNRLNDAKSDVVTESGISGDILMLDNPLITSQDRAVAVGAWVESYRKNRMVLSSSWRTDPRLDALDIVSNVNDFNTNSVRMTEVKFTYNGAFRGTGEGRVINGGVD